MNKKINNEISAYCNDIKKMLICKRSLKYVFMADFRSRIEDFIETKGSEKISMEDIICQFGTPDVIVQSFYDMEDIKDFRKKARKHIIYKILAITAILLLIVASVFLIVILSKDNNYTITNNF